MVTQDRKTSGVSLFLKTIISIALYLFLLYFLGDKSSPVKSLYTHVFIAFFALVFFSTILLKDLRYTVIVSIALFIKIFLGVLHYLYFINPNYFSEPSTIYLHYEYKAYFKTICTFANDNINIGYFDRIDNVVGSTHPQLLKTISYVFRYGGNYILTISPLNAMLSLFSALIITYIAAQKKLTTHLNTTLILAAYFPSTLISSLLIRDIAGQFLMVFGIALIVLSRKRCLFISIIFTSYLFFMQRTIYIFIPFIAYFLYNNTLIGKNYFLKNKSKNKTLFFPMIGLIIFLLPVLNNIFEKNSGYFLIFNNVNAIILFPFKALLGLMGPFPWSQFTESYENSYQLQDYLMAVFMITTLWLLIPLLKKLLIICQGWSYLTIIGLILIIVGIMNPYMHITYISIGFIFLIPLISDFVPRKQFNNVFTNVLLLFFLLNILYITLGLRGMGLALFFR